MPLRSGIVIIDKAEDGRTPQCIRMQKLLNYTDDGEQQLVGGPPVPHEIVVDVSRPEMNRLDIAFGMADQKVVDTAIEQLQSRKGDYGQLHAGKLSTRISVDRTMPEGVVLHVSTGGVEALSKVIADPAIAPFIPPDDLQQYIQPALDAKTRQMRHVSKT